MLLAAVVLVAACSDRPAGSASPTPTVPLSGDAIHRLQEAVDRYSSYGLTVEQSNFVLPSWGGSDGGTVSVADDGAVVQADLVRTGEPKATYHIMLTHGQTYFKRSTCENVFRVPGGPSDVLAPFVFFHKGFTRASNVRSADGLLEATLPTLGPVTIAIDPSTGLPKTIRGANNGKPLVWTFSDWGHAGDSIGFGFTPPDRGPGGIPC